MKRWRFEIWLFTGVVFLNVFLYSLPPAHAEGTQESGVEFFKDPKIDFWKENSVPVNPERVAVAPKRAAPPSAPKTTFTWNKYLNPSNDEFFKEGDYLPPPPFMEIARNPTDQNIENWFKYLETKNSLLQTLQVKLAAYTARKSGVGAASPEIEPDALKRIQQRYETPQAPALNAKQFRLRLYFDSHCPHCEHMMGTVRELMQLGYWVELRQIDDDVSARAKIPFAVASATPEELKRYQIESVPVLLVGNLKKQSFFKIQGYQPSAEVLKVLNGKSQ